MRNKHDHHLIKVSRDSCPCSIPMAINNTFYSNHSLPDILLQVRFSTIDIGRVINKFSLLCIHYTDSNYGRRATSANEPWSRLVIESRNYSGLLLMMLKKPNTSDVLKAGFLFPIRDKNTTYTVTGYTEERRVNSILPLAKGLVLNCSVVLNYLLLFSARCLYFSTPLTSGFM